MLVNLKFDKAEHLLHRLIVGDSPDGYQVDHIDGNPLNNTRCNLRIVTAHQILWNCSMPNNTGFVGFTKEGNKFRAQIKVNGQMRRIGAYATAEEAAVVRDDVMQYVGKGFAEYNFDQHERCVSPKQMYMSDVAAFLNKHCIAVV